MLNVSNAVISDVIGKNVPDINHSPIRSHLRQKLIQFVKTLELIFLLNVRMSAGICVLAQNGPTSMSETDC